MHVSRGGGGHVCAYTRVGECAIDAGVYVRSVITSNSKRAGKPVDQAGLSRNYITNLPNVR